MRGQKAKRRAVGRRWRVVEFYDLSVFVSHLPSIIVPLCCVLLMCMFVGCESQDVSESTLTPAQETKADLLEQLDEKFENPDVHCKLGQLYGGEGRFTKAEYHLKTALEFDPVHRPSQAAMVKMFVDSSDKAKAQLYADTYMKQASGSATESLGLGQAFQEQGLDEYAFACYQQAMTLRPNSPDVNKQMGYYYLSKQDNARAQEYLSRSFQANPNQPDVARELGRLGVVVEIPRLPESSSRESKRSSDETPADSAKAKAG